VPVDPLQNNTEPGPEARDAEAPHSDSGVGVDALKCDLLDTPLGDSDGPVGRIPVTAHPSTRQPEVVDISYAAFEFELDLMRKRLAVWEIFLRHLKAGATSWTEVQGALTHEDLSEIVRICEGRSLRDLMVHRR
jgi:hypothetical protein